MSEVQVLPKTKIVPNGRNRGSTGALKIDRIRVAAYCRVSTDDDEQLGSFESQKLYYEQKIASNKEWVNAGIFADEAVTGTKTDKRSGFQDMIVHCHNGEIDMILTKSISRFARNTVDTLNYVRILRSRSKTCPALSERNSMMSNSFFENGMICSLQYTHRPT